jgi:hypothetical protein
LSKLGVLMDRISLLLALRDKAQALLKDKAAPKPQQKSLYVRDFFRMLDSSLFGFGNMGHVEGSLFRELHQEDSIQSKKVSLMAQAVIDTDVNSEEALEHLKAKLVQIVSC